MVLLVRFFVTRNFVFNAAAVDFRLPLVFGTVTTSSSFLTFVRLLLRKFLPLLFSTSNSSLTTLDTVFFFTATDFAF